MRVTVLRFFIGVIGISIVMGFFSIASAERYSGGSYIIDASVIGNSVGGEATGGSYKLISSGGESIIGNGTGGSYKIGTGYVAQLDKSLQLTVQPSGLVAYYPLDEPNGRSAYDAAYPGYTLNAVDMPDRATGKIGGALGPVTLASQKYLLGTETSAFNTSYVTACAWVYKTASGTNPSIVTHGDGGFTTNGMWYLGYNNGQKPRFGIHVGGTDYINLATNLVSLNAWHHICGTYDGTDSKVYVDGVLDGTMAISAGALPSPNHIIAIGARTGGTHLGDTQTTDEVKIFNRALTLDEIQAEYQAGNAGSTAGVSLGAITSGVSRSADADITIRTDSASYSVAVNQDHDLQSGANTIPAISDAIATPGIWSEGTTKGLGFSLSSAPGLDAKWSSGTKFAYFPSAATTLYNRTAATLGTKDLITMKIRADVAISQPEGDYQNTITVTGTTIP